jgi:toxin FitB
MGRYLLALAAQLSLRKAPKQSEIFQSWFHVLTAFQGSILSVDTAIALRSAAMHVPDPRPIRDALIAATAMAHHMQIVTGNVADFEGLGPAVINTWQAPQ